MESLPTYSLTPALRKSKSSYAGAANPSGRTQRSYDEARRVGPKGSERYDGALRAEISSAMDRGLEIEDIQGHLRTSDDLGTVCTLIDASIRDGAAGQIEHRARALIAYFERVIPPIRHCDRRAWLKHIVVGLKLSHGTNAQKAEAKEGLV